MLLRKKVHGAAPPLAASGFLAKQFTHYLPGRHAGTEGMHMVAVGAAEPVVLGLHRLDNPGGDRLLAVVEMHEAKHLAPVVHLGALVFKAPAQAHVAVEHQPLSAADIRAETCGGATGCGFGGHGAPALASGRLYGDDLGTGCPRESTPLTDVNSDLPYTPRWSSPSTISACWG